MFCNQRKITGIIVRILFLSALVLGAAQRAEAAVWTTVSGRVLTQVGTPVCAMVLANGQYAFSCDAAGNYSFDAPLDNNNLITLQVFATGFAPFSQTQTAVQAAGYDVSMDRDTTGRAFTVINNLPPTPLPNGWVTVSGTIKEKGNPVCAMILINGQTMFSCNGSLGTYSLEVPRDSNGQITLQAFAAGFMPHRDTFGVNDPPIATGQCATTFQADAYSNVLKGNDPEASLLTYSLIYPDGSPAGTGPVATANGGSAVITNNTTGAYTYTPNPAADKRGRDSFQYQITDSGSGNLSDGATETVIVNQTIMPLGDSITSGTGSSVVGSEKTGYRRPLQDSLTAAGYTFDFVGGDSKGIDAVPAFDYNNEGHGGWSAAQLRDGGGLINDPTDGTDARTFDWLEDNPADIVLLHAGTNGLTVDGSNAIDVAGTDSILSEIRRWEATGNNRNPVTVVLALIIDQNPYNGDAVKMFNANLQTLADDRITAGEDIFLVDQYNALVYPDDMYDGLHPNIAGYSSMATEWYSALTAIVDKCP